jgi:hypothetical protein
MKGRALLFSLCLAATAQSAMADEPPTAPSPQPANPVHAACAADIQKLCADVQPGGGRIIACLRQHRDEVSDGCKQAMKAMHRPAPNSPPS